MTYKFEVPIHFKTPRRLAKKPKLTVREMARHVTPVTRKKSKIVGIEELKVVKTPNFLPGYITYRLRTRNTVNRHRYRVTIFSPTPKITLDSKVIIDCPNPNFVFRFEYALAKRGNAFIYRTNGDRPIKTNPRLNPGFDHHTYAALQFLIKATRKLKAPPEGDGSTAMQRKIEAAVRAAIRVAIKAISRGLM